MKDGTQSEKIFLVEDNLEVSRMYERAFRLHGHEIEVVYYSYAHIRESNGFRVWPRSVWARLLSGVASLDDLLVRLDALGARGPGSAR